MRLLSSTFLLASSAAAQAPEVLYYTFDGMDAANVASPGVGDGVANADVVFGPGICGAGAAIAGGAAARIETGWRVDLGTGSWTIGMWIDLSAGGNAFQYFWGSASTGGVRCFCGGVAGVDGIMMRTLEDDVVLPGGAPTAGPTHCAWIYDAPNQTVRGYVNGALVATVVQGAPLDIVGTAADFEVMDYVGAMDPGNVIDDLRVYRRAIGSVELDAWVQGCGTGNLGIGYCGPAVPNSTGAPAVITAGGSDVASMNDVTLRAAELPVGSFGFFLASRVQGTLPNPGGSEGTLCLAGSIGRYVGPGQIQQSGSTGAISLALNLSQVPQPTGFVVASAGQTWNFQAWYRDAIGGQATSNFTDGLAIDFR
ncbi:MAG: LamG-like jellyroll fold domain-containing protein [Planctomycetota bacterium]